MVFLLIGMATLWGLYSIKNITLDAIPDLSDTQVIIFSRWDRIERNVFNGIQSP